jgi:transcription termination/antitermination protein NusA
MNGEVLRIVDSIHRDKNIEKEIVFQGIEMALLSAARKFFPETDDVTITIDRETGHVSATHNGQPLAPEVLGRIPAQTAKQIIIQKIREAERDSQYEEFASRVGETVHGTVQRQEGGAVTVNLGKTEGILPRSEQIPGESHHVGERIRAVIVDVRKTNQRVKIILSRTHPDFVRRLFELEIPEIAERVIDIKALAREAGYRSKVAVISIDSKVDCVGACVGVRGTRIKNIVDELAGERIDIVRWNESLQVMIPNALQPAEVEDVMLFPMLGRAIVLVKEDQLSLAIGRRGQNVRLASKLVGWDIEIMTSEELDEQIDRAVGLFASIPNTDPALIDRFVEQGFLSFDDLSIMDPEELAQLEGLDVVKATEIVQFAELEAERLAREGPPPKTKAEAAVESDSVEESAPPEATSTAETGDLEQGASESEPAAAETEQNPASAPPGNDNGHTSNGHSSGEHGESAKASEEA